MTYETVATVAPTIGLILFMTLFAGVVAYALWPRNREKFRRAAKMPLDEE